MLMAATKAGKSFAEALRAQDLGITTSMTFSVATLSRSEGDLPEHADVLVPSVIRGKSGDIPEPVTVKDGALFVHIVAREQASGGVDADQRQRVARSLSQTYSRNVIGSWGEYVLAEASLKANPGFAIEADAAPAEGSDTDQAAEPEPEAEAEAVN
jgi:hypothetical protein